MLISSLLLLAAAPVQVVGPNPARCAPGGGPAMLVSVTGLKNRAGTVRVRSFGGSPSTYFDKKRALSRIEVPTPAGGAVQVCVPVAAPGWYAVDVRHDANANSDTDRADGGGASGNPRVTLFDILLGSKPPADKVRVWVGSGTTTVPVTIMYLKGTVLRPWDGGK